MSVLRSLAVIAALTAVVACADGKDDGPLSSSADPTEDLQAGMPPVDTERPSTDEDPETVDTDDTDVGD